MPKFTEPPYEVAINWTGRSIITIPKKIREKLDVSIWKIKIDFLEEKVTFIEQLKICYKNMTDFCICMECKELRQEAKNEK